MSKHALRTSAKVFVAGDLELSSFADEEGKKRVTFKVDATYRILNGGRRAEDSKGAVLG